MNKKSNCQKLETKDGYPVIRTLEDVEISHSMPPVILTKEQLAKIQRESEEKKEYANRVYWNFYHKVNIVSFMNTISDSTDISKEKISLSIRQINEKLSSVKNEYASAKNETRGKPYQIRKAAEGNLLECYQSIVNELREKEESLKRQFDKIERYIPCKSSYSVDDLEYEYMKKNGKPLGAFNKALLELRLSSMGNKQNNPTIPTTKTAKPMQTIEPIRWIGEKSLLPTFINYLQAKNFIGNINSTTEIIEQHFSDKSNNNIEPIKWLNSEPEILALFEALRNKEKISEEQFQLKCSLIAKHFINSKGKSFDPDQLAVSQHRFITHSKSRGKQVKKYEELISGLPSKGVKS